MRTENQIKPSTIYLKDYTPAAYDVTHIELLFQLFEEKTIVTATTQYRKNPASSLQDLVLHGEGQKITAVLLDNKPFDGYTLNDGKLSIANAGEKFTLSITTEIDPAANTALEGLYKSQGNYCTQCEAEGFRRITFYQDVR